MTEELASMNSLCWATSKNIFKEVEKISNLVQPAKMYTTPGDKNWCGAGKGLVGQIYKACGKEGY